MLGLVFLGLTSTKQRIECLAQEHKAVPAERPGYTQPLNLESSTLPLSHCAPLHFLVLFCFIALPPSQQLWSWGDGQLT